MIDYALRFVRGNVPDSVEPGCLAIFIVATVTKEGRQHCLPAYYLNAYPLEYLEACDERGCPKEENHDDGCPTTGWFYDESNFEYDNCYYALVAEVVAYAALPDPAALHGALRDAGAARVEGVAP